MKILHIGKYFPPFAGGMETYLRDLMSAQCRQGLEPAALVHQSALSLGSDSRPYRAGRQRLPVTRAALWARLIFTPISPGFPWLLRQLIQRQQPDVLHLHLPNVSAFWALLLPSARRIPWVLHWHADVLASEHSRGLRWFYQLYRPFERALLRRCAAVIATSPPYLESSEPLRAFRDKCHVVPLGLDPDNLAAPAAPAPRADPETLRVLAIGRLTYYKGFEYLIRAIAAVDAAELHLVGTGELEPALRQLAGELQARVIFHGKLSDAELAAQYRACDCLCLPSIERTEAFGMVLLEAMSHGKATIASDVPGSGMGWVVADQVTGSQVPPQDVAGLARRIGEFQADRGKLTAFGENGRRRFQRQFHIDQSTSGVSAVYREVIDPDTTGASQ